MTGTDRQRKNTADRKAEIVEAAIRLAGERGPDRVTTQHLADAVGVSQPAIFRHFPTKSDVWLAVGERIARAMAVDAFEGPEAEADPAGWLITQVTRHLDSVARHPAIPAILFSRELHAENEGLRAHFSTVMATRRAGFAALFAKAQARGQFRADADPGDAAALILATIQGLAMRASLDRDSFDLAGEGHRLMRRLIDGFRS